MFPRTQERIQKASEMISQGKGKSVVCKWLMDTYGLQMNTAMKYWMAACRMLIPDDMDEYRANLIQTNIERLEIIIDECMSDKARYKEAREAIAELNRMLIPAQQRAQFTAKMNPQDNTSEITISFE